MRQRFADTIRLGYISVITLNISSSTCTGLVCGLGPFVVTALDTHCVLLAPRELALSAWSTSRVHSNTRQNLLWALCAWQDWCLEVAADITTLVDPHSALLWSFLSTAHMPCLSAPVHVNTHKFVPHSWQLLHMYIHRLCMAQHTSMQES